MITKLNICLNYFNCSDIEMTLHNNVNQYLLRYINVLMQGNNLFNSPYAKWFDHFINIQKFFLNDYLNIIISYNKSLYMINNLARDKKFL